MQLTENLAGLKGTYPIDLYFIIALSHKQPLSLPELGNGIMGCRLIDNITTCVTKLFDNGTIRFTRIHATVSLSAACRIRQKAIWYEPAHRGKRERHVGSTDGAPRQRHNFGTSAVSPNAAARRFPMCSEARRRGSISSAQTEWLSLHEGDRAASR
jgi:hypothetical protein